MKLQFKLPSLRTSIQNKLLLPIIGLVILGMGIVVTTSYHSSSQTIIDNALVAMEHDLHVATGQLDAWIENRQRDMEHWGGSDVFHEALGEGFLAESARDGACTQLMRLKKSYDYYVVLIMADTTGKLVAAYDAPTYTESQVVKKVNISSRGYFKQVLATGKPVISDVLTSKSTGKQCIMLASPVKKDDKIIGVLVGSIDIHEINQLMGEDIENSQQYALMMDKNGVYVCHPDIDQRGVGNLNDLPCSNTFYDVQNQAFEYTFKGIHKMAISNTSKSTGWLLAETCDVDAIYASALQIGYLQTGVAFAVVVALILVIVLIVHTIVKPIRNVVDRLNDIASGEGDLTQRVDESRKDELGHLGVAFNTFISKIQGIIRDVSNVANDVAAASTQMAATSNEMSDGMDEQSRRAMEVASAVEEMSSTVVQVAQMSSGAATTASEAGTQAQQGGNIVAQTVDGINAISTVVNESASAIFELGKRGEQIGQIINVINDIADQTNLLALNAAIEAARAGEHGRGFAVVADEVRKLAERTTTATKEVAQSIEAIQTETDTAVNRMNEGTQRVEEGVHLAEKAGVSLKEIVEGSDKVAQLIQSIAAASEEQSSTSQLISQNVDSINAVTRQSAEGAKQAAMAADELSRKSERLQSLVSQFKL
ncbi:MAG: methyl-accepting chemotaxis protein [Phycisphaeraceae bacterium JB051]